jgi:hypothetical protein
MNAKGQGATLGDAVRTYRVACSALVTSSGDEASGEPSAADLTRVEGAYRALLNAERIGSDAEAIDALLFAEALLGRMKGPPDEERNIVEHIISRVANRLQTRPPVQHEVQYEGEQDSLTDARVAVPRNKRKLATASIVELHAMFAAAERAADVFVECTSSYTNKSYVTYALDEISAVHANWRDAAVSTMQDRFMALEKPERMDLVTEVLVRAALIHGAFSGREHELAAMACKAIGDLEAE